MLAKTIYELMLYGFLLVLFAGSYAILYAMGRFAGLPWLIRFSYIFALLQFLSGMGMFLSSYLDALWRYIVLFSSIAYLFIPPIMWRVVEEMHKRHDN
ncbi:MAG: hypothetical protein ACK4ZR_00165 [Aquificaceae bacterium]